MRANKTRGPRAGEAWVRARLRDVLAIALAAPAVAGCAGDDTNPALPIVDASLPPMKDASSAAPSCAPVNLDAALFGADGACDNYVRLPCGIPDGAAGNQCVPDIDLCTAACPTGFFFTCVYPSVSCEDGGLLPDADIVIECNTCLGNIGRRTRGLAEPDAAWARGRTSAVGEYLARAAYLEAASIDAFGELEARLVAHGAPRRLRKAAARALVDEKRHTRVTGDLARSFGAKPLTPRPYRATRATLERLATENAVEGCVRESMGALVAACQAQQATAPHVARAMRRIARDEARHAALAWAIDAWVTPRLSVAARERVRAAKLEAYESLRKEASRAVPVELASVAGLPTRAQAARIVTAFGRAFLTS